MKKIFVIFSFLVLSLFGFAQIQQMVENPARKNLIVKEWNTDVRTNTKFLDKVKIYNELGKKVEEIEYNSVGGQVWRKRYEHNGPKGKVNKEYLYDQNNRLVNYKIIEYNEMGKNTQTTYTPSGKVKSIKVFEYIATDAEKK